MNVETEENEIEQNETQSIDNIETDCYNNENENHSFEPNRTEALSYLNDGDTEGTSDSKGQIEPREERMKRLKEQSEMDRIKKMNYMLESQRKAQELREKEAIERKKKIQDMKQREEERKRRVEQRRREMEAQEREKSEYILKRNKERDERIALQKMSQSTTQNRPSSSSRMTTSLYGNNGAGIASDKCSNNNLPNYNNSSRSSWLLSSCDNININTNHNHNYYTHLSRSKKSSQSNNSATKNRTRSHDVMSIKSNKNCARRTGPPDGFIEIDNGVLIPSNTRHAACFVPYKGPSYRVRGVLAWRPSSQLSSSSAQSSPRDNTSQITKNSNNNSLAWWHDIKQNKKTKRPQSVQSNSRKEMKENNNNNIDDGDNNVEVVNKDANASLNTTKTKPYQRTSKRLSTITNRKNINDIRTNRTNSKMMTSKMDDSDSKSNNSTNTLMSTSINNTLTKTRVDPQSTFDRLAQPRRSGSQPARRRSIQNTTDLKTGNENVGIGTPKVKQSPLPARKMKSMYPNTPKQTKRSVTNNSVTTESTNKSTPILITKKPVDSSTPRDSGLSSSPISELEQPSALQTTQVLQETEIQIIDDNETVKTELSDNTTNSITNTTSKSTTNSSSPNINIDETTSTKKDEDKTDTLKSVTKETESPVTDTSVIKEQDSSTNISEEEAYRLKLAEEKRRAREKKEQLLEQQRKLEEENREKVALERKRREEEAKLLREQLRKQEEEQEAERLAELERQKQEEEEEMKRKEEEIRIAEEKRQEQLRQEEEARMERKRRLEQIMSRVKPSGTKTDSPNFSPVNQRSPEQSGTTSETEDAGPKDNTFNKDTSSSKEVSPVKEVWTEQNQVTPNKSIEFLKESEESRNNSTSPLVISEATQDLPSPTQAQPSDTNTTVFNGSTTDISSQSHQTSDNLHTSASTPQFKSKLLQSMLAKGRLNSSLNKPQSGGDTNSASSLLAHKRFSLVLPTNINYNEIQNNHHRQSIDSSEHNCNNNNNNNNSDNKTQATSMISYEDDVSMTHSKSLNCDLSGLSNEFSNSQNHLSVNNSSLSKEPSENNKAGDTFYLEEVNNNNEQSEATENDVIDDVSSLSTDFNMNQNLHHKATIDFS